MAEAEESNQFLLKTDDDSFVHLEALWDLAKSRLEKKSNNLMGYLQLGLKKHHYLPLAHKPTKSNLNGKWLKWLIPTYMYNKRFFPQFLSGSGYLVTRSAATCLLQKSKVNSKSRKFRQIEMFFKGFSSEKTIFRQRTVVLFHLTGFF